MRSYNTGAADWPWQMGGEKSQYDAWDSPGLA